MNKDLSTHASVDAGKKNLVPVVVDDVDSGEADEGLATVNVLPVVVGVGDVEFALVFGGVGVGVADQRSLPLSQCVSNNILVRPGIVIRTWSWK